MRYTLRFAAKNKETFDAVKKDIKTVETRAATERYRKVKAGDILVLVCGRERLEKKVLRAKHFKTVENLFRTIPIRKVNPFANSLKEAKETYYGYSEYREKIRKFGLMAFELGKNKLKG